LVKILITGDNHLNLYNQKLGAKLTERRARIGQAWWRTIEYAIENKVDLYIHTGDLFDQISPRNPPRARVVEGFKEMKDAGIKAYIVAGNHEAPSNSRDGASPHSLLKEAGLAYVFDSYTELQQYEVEIDGVEVSLAGQSYNRNLDSKEDPLKDKQIPGEAELNIAVLHYSIEEIAPPIWEEPVIKKTSIEENGHIQLYAMGHIHSHLETKINDSTIVYPGGTERYNFGEHDKDTGFVVMEYKDGELTSEYVKVEPQPMMQIRLHTSHMDHDDLTRSIIETIEENANEEGLFQIILEGELPFKKYAGINFSEIGDTGSSLYFFFEYIDIIRPTGEGLEFTPSEGLNPRKRLEDMANEAIENSEGREKEVWQRALELAVKYYSEEEEG
jgi:DNA repair exonuclease SbcCD nuclease subunit